MWVAGGSGGRKWRVWGGGRGRPAPPCPDQSYRVGRQNQVALVLPVLIVQDDHKLAGRHVGQGVGHGVKGGGGRRVRRRVHDHDKN